jgi:hypothetical protein
MLAAFQVRPRGWLGGTLLVLLVAIEWIPLAAAETPAPDAAKPGTPSVHESQASSAPNPARYPFDPVCPWGRVADGQGILLRCLDRAEAQGLVGTLPARATGAAPTAATAAAAPVTAPAAAPVVRPAAYKRVMVQQVGPAQADTGELPEAQAQLRKVQERYAQCVEDSGGLERAEGRVTLRFLVRERGRAEGVAVKDRQGVSLAAAKCVAQVVDRRYVGYPAAPIVGATLSIDFVPEGAAR